MPLAPLVCSHTRSTLVHLHAKPVHLISLLAAGRCRTTGGRAVMTWRTWRNGRSCLQTYGGRHLTNRSCCAGGSTRGGRRQPTRASRRDSVNALSYCLHVSRTSEIRESCVALYHPSARVRPPGRLFFRFHPRGFGAFANRARATSAQGQGQGAGEGRVHVYRGYRKSPRHTQSHTRRLLNIIFKLRLMHRAHSLTQARTRGPPPP